MECHRFAESLEGSGRIQAEQRKSGCANGVSTRRGQAEVRAVKGDRRVDRCWCELRIAERPCLGAKKRWRWLG